VRKILRVSPHSHIVFVEQFYYPEGWGGAQIPLDITTGLANAQRSVTVLCGKDPYVAVQESELRDPRKSGVNIRYVPRFRLGRANGKGVIAQLWFSLAAAVMSLTGRRPSLFIVQTNPPLMVVAMSLIAGILKVPLVIIAQDLYPEVMIAHRMISAGGVAGRVLTSVFRFAYRHAAVVVSLGPRMTERLSKKEVSPDRVVEISNWATGDLEVVRGSANELIATWGLEGKFVLLYSGNLGVAHDAETLLRSIAAARLQLPNLRLVIVGKGGRIEQARQFAIDLEIKDLVLFKELVPSALLPQTLGIAHLALVTLLPGFDGLVVPSKLLGYMARGIPTLYIGPREGDVAALLERSDGGICVANGAVENLASRLVQLANDPASLTRMGTNARAYYDQFLSRTSGLARYDQMVAEILGGGSNAADRRA
jgi:colanic acid biosynthesis glycosyl transferase WcaI